MYNVYCYTILKSILYYIISGVNSILPFAVYYSILYYIILSCALMHYIVYGTLLDMHCTIINYATQYFTGIHIDVLWNTVINGISLYYTLDYCTVL